MKKKDKKFKSTNPNSSLQLQFTEVTALVLKSGNAKLCEMCYEIKPLGKEYFQKIC